MGTGIMTTSTIDATEGGYLPCKEEEVVISPNTSFRGTSSSYAKDEVTTEDSWLGGEWTADHPDDYQTPVFINNVPEYDSPTVIALRPVSGATELLGCNTDVGTRPEEGVIRDDSYYVAKEAGSWVLEGHIPENRARMANATDGRRIYNFGGVTTRYNPTIYGYEEVVINDFWYYDTETHEIVELNNGGITPRIIAYAVFLDGKFYMYGGYSIDFDASSFIKEFWVYDVALETWTQLSTPIAKVVAQLTIMDGDIWMNMCGEPIIGNIFDIHASSYKYVIETDTWGFVFTQPDWTPANGWYSLSGQVSHKGQFYYWNTTLINVVPSEQVITNGVDLTGIQQVAEAMSYGDFIIFHGGLDIGSGEGNTDIWWYDTVNRYYGRIDVVGKVPRVNHSITQQIVGDKLWVLGGMTYAGAENLSDNTIWSIDLKEYFKTIDTCGAFPVPPDTMNLILFSACKITATHPCPPPPTYVIIEYTPPE